MVGRAADVHCPEFQGLVAGDGDPVEHQLAPVDEIRLMFTNHDLQGHIGRSICKNMSSGIKVRS